MSISLHELNTSKYIIHKLADRKTFNTTAVTGAHISRCTHRTTKATLYEPLTRATILRQTRDQKDWRRKRKDIDEELSGSNKTETRRTY